jgi:dipeptidyl aminopeptidase/acylaminoacyl peptidase
MAHAGRRTLPYGSWPSALTAERALAGTLRLGYPQIDQGLVYWLEGRPAEAGRQVVVRVGREGSPEDVTASEVNVRTLVHEYGGGDYRVSRGRLVYVDFSDQRVFLLEAASSPRPLTAPGSRYADFAWSPDGRFLAAVEERHRSRDHAPAAEPPENRLVAIALSAQGEEIPEPRVIAAGHDFVSSPCFSPDGRSLAYTAWSQPQMPWDGTRLYLQTWGESGPLGPAACVAGGDGESIFQPRFSPDGYLTFVSDRSGWWNLYRLEAGGDATAVCAMEAEFGRPQWVFGISTYAYIDPDEILCSVSRNGRDRLCRLELARGRLTELELPFSYGVGVEVENGVACFVAASGDLPTAIHRLDLASGELQTLRSSLELDLTSEQISMPEAIEYPTAQGRSAHAFFYAPRNPGAVGPADERPPLIVKSHGGPTSAAVPVLNPSIQYWTSRGFAVVDVNYGGSTGYGRAYRDRLRGQWGVVDVEDCVNAARYLASEGRVDPDRMAISGGSAGGFTTLCALTFHDVFAAGASHYGIGDLEALARDTHKFEARYLDNLIGPYPERADLYRERSPIHSSERLSCPVIFFQGLQDRVVPPNQAEAMVAALSRHGIRHAHVTFPDEQHGFRRAENIRTALEGELYFYGRIFGFDVDVSPEGVEIVP